MTPKQQLFADEYMADLNATQAAIRAGYSRKTADVQGPRLLGNVGVQQAIQERMAERAEACKVDGEWVLKRLVIEALLQGAGASHSARVRALELIGRHITMFHDRLEISGRDGGPIRTDVEITVEERRRQLLSLLETLRQRKEQEEKFAAAGCPPPSVNGVGEGAGI